MQNEENKQESFELNISYILHTTISFVLQIKHRDEFESVIYIIKMTLCTTEDKLYVQS